ncbi:hypothetical protein ACOME3_003812 [Neoechinorhynchus agilis]
MAPFLINAALLAVTGPLLPLFKKLWRRISGRGETPEVEAEDTPAVAYRRAANYGDDVILPEPPNDKDLLEIDSLLFVKREETSKDDWRMTDIVVYLGEETGNIPYPYPRLIKLVINKVNELPGKILYEQQGTLQSGVYATLTYTTEYPLKDVDINKYRLGGGRFKLREFIRDYKILPWVARKLAT